MKWLLLMGLLTSAAAVASWQYLTGDRRVPENRFLHPHLDVPAPAIQGIGYVEPASEVRQLMLRSGGVIRQCFVSAGTTVRQGEPLLELDNAVEQAEVEMARRQLEQAQAEAAHAHSGINPHRIRAVEQTVERLREQHRHAGAEAQRLGQLFAARSASREELDAAQTQRRQAELALREQEAELLHLRHFVTPEHSALLAAKVRHAEAGLALAEQRLRDTRLLAPFGGTVLKLLRRAGEGVRAFEPEPVVLFGDLARLRVRAEIDERFVRHLAVGQAAVVYGRNLAGQEYRGQVVQIEPIMGAKTVFTRASSERKDLDVLQLLIEMEPGFQAPVGLQVDVRIEAGPASSS
jgi:HlyD family secretion protein